jgi:chemotaxis protein methyltransferase CheR
MDGVVIEPKDEEVEEIINDLLEIYGYDFTNYSRASFKRRIIRLITNDRFLSFAEFRFRVQNDKEYLTRFVQEITVTVTEMFRDPTFYKVLREEVLPKLGTNPLIRIWHAGCATGEEVYSMAIMLHEANLLHKSLLYATDINPSVLDTVRSGVFPIANMKTFSQNYMLSGGTRDFSSYYTAQYNVARIDSELGRRIIFSTHNLVSDRSFNEFQLILCRNVMIYFDKTLQDKVLKLLDDSLEVFGYLALGTKENLRFSGIQSKYKQINLKEKIWKKTTK